MIKKIIGCSDIHIRNLKRQDEYVECLKAFIADIKSITEVDGEESVRVVIVGDLLHNKLDISPEGYMLAKWFLSELDKICTTYVIAGNHDISMSNIERLDPISAIFSMCNFKRVKYLDKELDYSSGFYNDENVVFTLYSSFDSLIRPNIDEFKVSNKDKVYIGLYHGTIVSSKTDTGYISENGDSTSIFDGLDFVIMGHIHKRQELINNGVPLVYCGSLIQQDFGESIYGHGYIVLDLDKLEYQSIDIKNKNYGYYTFSINSIEDIEEDREELINV